MPALLVVLTATLLALFAAQGATAAGCQADYCTTLITEPDGRAALKIPGKLVRIGYPELKECTWEVEAQYGDGSASGEYVFSEAIGLEAEHTYPEPGVYIFNAYATHGIHDGTTEPCPDVHIEATVIYPDPSPVKVPEEPAPEGPQTPPPGGGAAAQPPASAPASGSPSRPYWRGCGRGIRAHLLTCNRARKVIGAARNLISRARTTQGAVFQVSGFSCRLRHDGAASLSCRHGRQRVLGA